MNFGKGLYLFFLSIVCTFVFITFTENRANSQDTLYLDNLVQVSDAKGLHEDKYWHTLVHYKQSSFGLVSLIDDPKFFLAQDGKKNPRAELHATIRAFFQSIDPEDNPPICRFIARYSWLKEKLGFDESKLPTDRCEKIEKIVDSMKPESASLIFPTSHINSPASMFGHTLIIINTEGKSKLLSYAINYSAITNERFGPIFAAKGVFGLYRGYFSVLPYYTKVQEYSDLDYRDMWEYELNLSKDEVKRMLLHLLELETVYSDYFFLDENCSSNLLYLIEAARPSLSLTDRFRYWVLPIDTIRAVERNGLIKNVEYRPSRTTKIKHIAATLTDGQQMIALAIVNDGFEPEGLSALNISTEEKIKIYDFAVEYLQFIYTRKKITQEQYQKRLVAVLKSRSLLGNPDEGQYKIPTPRQPLEGHRPNRLSLLAGVKAGKSFQEVGYKPAYHELLDLTDGFVETGQINFGNLALRYYPSGNRLQMQNIDFIDVISLSPIDRFFKAWSWKAKTGLTRIDFTDKKSGLVYQFNFGGGVTFRFSEHGVAYMFVEPDLNIGGKLERGFACGGGGSIGILQDITSFWKVHLFARDMYYPWGDEHNLAEAGISQNIFLNANNALTFQAARKKTFGTNLNHVSVGWMMFF